MSGFESERCLLFATYRLSHTRALLNNAMPWVTLPARTPSYQSATEVRERVLSYFIFKSSPMES